MKKQLVIIGILALLVSIELSGCNEIEEQNVATPSIVTFSVAPYSIEEGQTAELSWNVKNATLVVIDNGIGNVSLMGNRIITPLNTTTYTLTAINKNKETYASCQIIVTEINYELKLVGTWNCTLGELAIWYQTLIFYPDKTARFGEIDSSMSGGWGHYADYDSWSVDNGTLITIQEPYHSYLNWTIRFDGNTLVIQNETMFPGWESRYEKIS